MLRVIRKMTEQDFVTQITVPRELVGDTTENSYIIKLKDGVDINKINLPDKIKIKHRYDATNTIHIEAPVSDLHLIEDQAVNFASIETDAEYKVACLDTATIINDNQYFAQESSQTIGAFQTRIGSDRNSVLTGYQKSDFSKEDINVFVVDTGISLHPDLNVVGGRNFTTSDPDDWVDRHGHGTHVAGLIGAKNNDFGIVGGAPGVKLWAIKVLSDGGGGSLANIIAGLTWIYQNRFTVWDGLAIVNMSLSGPASNALDQVIDWITYMGIIVVSAAGNEAIHTGLRSPARSPRSLTVGATAESPNYSQLAFYSNFGPNVKILAPGNTITSTYLNGKYATMSGTSMAAPIVTGIMALILATQPVVEKGRNTARFVENAYLYMYLESMKLVPLYYDGSQGTNNRVKIPAGLECTNVSLWAGRY